MKKLLFILGISVMTTACSDNAPEQTSASTPESDPPVVSASASISQAQHPKLVSSPSDVIEMRVASTQSGRFGDAFTAIKAKVDANMALEMNVPLPKDAGGGFTHEQHKKNYQLMNEAGIVFQITQDQRYAKYVESMLLAYAEFYPDLGFHPKRKEQSPGKLFWQSLNEAMWLVYTSQAYDYVKEAIAPESAERIEARVLRPMALFLSVESPETFDKVHNHGTWANAAVGMMGIVLGEVEWVEKALLGLDKSGDAGFLKQLDVLFSPNGYYNEGPYYQRFALLPFVLFSKAVDQNYPEKKIFEHRDGILMKAITATIELSYNGLFFGINDAIKDKGITTIELVYGVSIAYGLTKNTQLLDIATTQDQVILTGDGLRVAQALDANQATPYEFANISFGDGAEGTDGALIIKRENVLEEHQALVFKATSQGLGHGHFDKLNYIYYNNGEEIVRDYGAARFLNIEAKYGGHYLPENNAYAKQTVAHNTLIVDETSHFNGVTNVGNQFAPNVDFVLYDEAVSISKATMRDAYDNVVFDRTLAFFTPEKATRPLIIDVMNIYATGSHQYDLPVHYLGQLIETNFTLKTNTKQLLPMGDSDGYEFLWHTASAMPEQLAQITWLQKDRFYTHSSYLPAQTEILFGRAGANDPNFNFVEDKMFMLRTNATDHQFINILETHGEYNGTKEFTVNAKTAVSALSGEVIDDIQVVDFIYDGQQYLLVFARSATNADTQRTFSYDGQTYSITGQYQIITLGQ